MTTQTPEMQNGAALALTNEPTNSKAISAFSSEENFVAAQRMARALASSTLVPAAYQNNIPNVLIAMEMASRIGMSVFMVMQSLDIIHGRPSWSSKFLIATVNASGRFTPLRFRWEGKAGSDDWGCRAVAHDRSTGEECVGPLVTIKTAKDEGWHGKSGSKWKTLPELMLMYRSGGFWTRVYCPELSLGMQTTEEAIDMGSMGGGEGPALAAVGSPKALEQALLGPGTPPAAMFPAADDGAPNAGPQAPQGATAAAPPANAPAAPAAPAAPPAAAPAQGSPTTAGGGDPLAAQIAAALNLPEPAVAAMLAPLRNGKDAAYLLKYKAKGANLDEGAVRAIVERYNAAAKPLTGGPDPRSPEAISAALGLPVATVQAVLKAGVAGADANDDQIALGLVDRGVEVTAAQVGEIFARANG